MNDQAERLRILARNLREQVSKEIKGKPGVSRILAVTSGKGGVGKTNLSLNLALAMIDYGCRVLLLDADMGTANVDIILGIAPKYNFYHVIEGRKRLADIIVEGPKGLKIVPGASGIRELANLQPYRIEQLLLDLKKVEQMTDLMIIDTGAGVSDSVIKFLLIADEVIVVTTPEPTSLTDAYALIKILNYEKKDLNLRLVVNRVRNEKEGSMVAQNLQTVSRKYLEVDMEFAGYILNDSVVSESVRRQEPFVLAYPKAPATNCVYLLAAHLCQLEHKKPVLRPVSFLQKIQNIFCH